METYMETATSLNPELKAFYSQKMSVEDLDLNNNHRSAFANLWLTLLKDLPDGRYKSMVKSKLEEAQMLATKALSHK